MIDLKVKPTIVGEKIILRPFQPEDISFMEESIKDPEVKKFTGSSGDYDTKALSDWYNTRNQQEDRLDLAIVDKNTEEVVGEAVINEYDEDKESMNYRILIGPRGRDRGFGSEATKLMVDYVFEHTVLKQVTLGVYAFNPRAQRVYEKVGFIIESVDRAELEHEGKWIDAYNMTLTRERWEKIRSGQIVIQ